MSPALVPFSVALLALAAPAAAADTAPATALQSDLDHVWVLTAAALVFFMQVGFLLLEAGTVRSKNSVNVAQKNLMDFLVSTATFGGVGFMLMFGASQSGLFGWDTSLLFFGAADDWAMAFFVYQLMFCGTAATIMSGAVAERMSINGYLIGAVLIALVIYPVAGHWAWGGLLGAEGAPYLASKGFLDFAGSTVVHSVGAWVALAAIVILGPRIGKFDENGKPRVLHGHSSVLATSGALILYIGWIGFNGGSLLSGGAGIAPIVVNTIVAGAAGGLALMAIGKAVTGVYRPDASINGLLGGLVAITASADLMDPSSAFFIGFLGGVVVFVSTWVMENVFKLDDPLGAIAVHGFAGAFGTIALAVFAPAEALPAGTRLAQAMVQIEGVAMVFAWAFGVAFAVFKVADLVMQGPDGGRGLRVSERFEIEGLNQHEHDSPMGTGILQTIMADIARNHGGQMSKVELDYGDEAYETSVLFNRIIDNIAAERATEEQTYQTRKAERMAVEAEVAEVVASCSRGDYSKRLSTAGRDGFLLELCNGINALCEASENGLTDLQRVLDEIGDGCLTARMAEGYEGRFAELGEAVDRMSRGIGELMASIGETAGSVSDAGAEIAAASDRFHRRSTDQAQAIDASVQLLDELAASAAETAQEAQRADALCQAALRHSEAGQALSSQLMSQIEDIQGTTGKITQALELIESIARQTTLLSINASVEAARSGGPETSNEGFKVVAQEVRALAQRSSDAANEIRERTKSVHSSVTRGVDLVAQAANALREINGAMAESSGTVSRLALTGGEQMTRAAAIQTQVRSISEMASANLALAAETSALSHRLDSNAQETLAQLARFDLPDGDDRLAA